eukprot:TRINITY_DN1887_c0_g2_i1.p1 TRINITY_DN1887_c0_g2~~TRINITY_DN1887_c0_g2_i1.p1  ORF type:complete len:372 (+),score=55.64 TRINITY_DN1887_c0_g2_i1:1291-2406(+)
MDIHNSTEDMSPHFDIHEKSSFSFKQSIKGSPYRYKNSPVSPDLRDLIKNSSNDTDFSLQASLFVPHTPTAFVSATMQPFGLVPTVVDCQHELNPLLPRLELQALDEVYAKQGKLLHNVFVTRASSKRFLYFTDDNSRDGDEGTKRDAWREKSVSFDEFLMRSRRSGETGEFLYLYGEPLIDCLKEKLDFSWMSKCGDISSVLLWISMHGSCSPLHFDLTEGLLMQVQGRKTVYMFPPSFYNELHPFPINHPCNRQSMINDIHDPDLSRFPEFEHCRFEMLEFTIEPGQMLYIPFGWWHQVEGRASLDQSEPNVSLTFRWNPYAETIDKVIATRNACKGMPVEVVGKICHALMSELPHSVSQVISLRSGLI